MEYEDIEVGNLYSYMDIKVKVVEKLDDTIKVRLPNGAFQEVFPDELE